MDTPPGRLEETTVRRGSGGGLTRANLGLALSREGGGQPQLGRIPSPPSSYAPPLLLVVVFIDRETPVRPYSLFSIVMTNNQLDNRPSSSSGQATSIHVVPIQRNLNTEVTSLSGSTLHATFFWNLKVLSSRLGDQSPQRNRRHTIYRMTTKKVDG